MAELEYIIPLKALNDIPFPVGKKLLMDFLQGRKNQSIQKNKLYRENLFGYFELYDTSELEHLLRVLFRHKLIERTKLNGGFMTVLSLTDRGMTELRDPQLKAAINGTRQRADHTPISEKERKAFSALSDFLGGLDDFQKKAVISDEPTIACIAGAGSGKTTVLAKRIEFLMRYKGVAPSSILAVTFTRKARAEMQSRLGHCGVDVHTFNSFCERFIRTHTPDICDEESRVITFREKIALVTEALKKQGMSRRQVLTHYFSKAKQRSSSEDELFFSFLNDCFGLRDLINTGQVHPGELTTQEGEIVGAIVDELNAGMKERGLRDFSDQLSLVLSYLEEHPSRVPQYEHILVDEYQDVNDKQMQLIKTLAAPNLFCVGDPRQSIYGWRGSRMEYLMEFSSHFNNPEIIYLANNYRSAPCIIDLANRAIREMGLPDLVAHREDEGHLMLHECGSQEEEAELIVKEICKGNHGRMFVLARTNKQLDQVSAHLSQLGVAHEVRTEAKNDEDACATHQLILSTVHAIKGMEADTVFLMGCGSLFFPCKVSDHPVFDGLSVFAYDRELEELRLFYVAMTRAKRALYMTYAGSQHTPFISPDMKSIIRKGA